MCNASDFHVGQEVLVEGTMKQGLKATWWAYVVPLILVVCAILVVVLTGGNDALAALAALGVLVVYYVIMYQFRSRFEDKFGFTIVTTN